MRKKSIQHQMDGLVALLLFGVFAACVLAVLLTGAGVYQRLTERDQAACSRRTFAQYIATRVRQADCLDGVSVEDFDGVPALTLWAEDGYVTRVYWYDGYLMELYTDVSSRIPPAEGDRLMEAGGPGLSLAAC